MDMIHKGPASFYCLINVPVSVIIPVLKKKALFLTHPRAIINQGI